MRYSHALVHINSTLTPISTIVKLLFTCFLALLIPIIVLGNQPNNKNKKTKDQHSYTASIGNWVWLDMNRDGIQDDFEEGLNNFTVILYSVQTHQVFSTKTDFHAKTGEAGYYQFNNLPPGKYMVVFEIPEGYKASPKDVDNNQNDVLDSDADPISGATDIISLRKGESEKSWSIGLCIPTFASID